MSSKFKVELLAPAGNLEKLETALHFGADAVYLGGGDFSLRTPRELFDAGDIAKAVAVAHSHGVKVYVAVNIFARNRDLTPIARFLGELGRIGPDALIVSDPGVIATARRIVPHLPLHLSTQANTTNIESVLFWQNQGLDRINLARELSLSEIQEINQACDIATEVFVHGAMCMAWSGRCLLSTFLTGRDSNRGRCSHPCRWRYHLVEETRPGQYLPITSDAHGTYILHARDLCMIEHLPDLIQTGVRALKIEGRMKSVHYVAATLKAYRLALDAYYADPEAYQTPPESRRELDALNHRGYGTGFYMEPPHQADAGTPASTGTDQRFLGIIADLDTGGWVWVDVRNKFGRDQALDILPGQGPAMMDRALEICDQQGAPIDAAQPNARVRVRLGGGYQIGDLIRKFP